MYRRIYTLLEIINIILCLHYLRGKKPKINIGTVLLICVHELICEFVERYELDSIVIVLLYLLVFVYTINEFGDNIRNAIISNMLYIIILGIIELFATLLLLLLNADYLTYDIIGIYANAVALLILFCIKNILYHLFSLVNKRNSIIIVITSVFGLAMVNTIFRYKKQWKISVDNILLITIFGCIVAVLLYCWQIEREKVYRKEIELQMHNLYDASFKELIRTIQEKQHDFYNHIQAIRCQHYTLHTYEELVEAQEKYCDSIMDDNKYYRLLSNSSPVLTGFLYGKFVEADKEGVEIVYSVRIGEIVNELPEYVLIEIIGILWDNAVEAVKEYGDKRIELRLEKEKEFLLLEVGNPVTDIGYTDIQHFFERGYSGKQEHSGIGLHKVNQYSKKYDYDLVVDKRKADGIDWLFFKVCFGSRSH